MALYKGLGAVVTGIAPKMAIRFTSFEWYKQLLTSADGNLSGTATFFAGLSAGVTEAVAVVTPMEVVKIRLQGQYHSMADPLDVPKYRNAAHACFTIVKEEGVGALYRGVALTALRQGSNQAGELGGLVVAKRWPIVRRLIMWATVNFTAYSYFKTWLQEWQKDTLKAESGGGGSNLPGYQTAFIGLVSGAMGPLSNAPIDTIKTRLQKTPSEEGQTSLQRIKGITSDMWRQEGSRAFYKGITPRIMRVAPGQAVTFFMYV